MSHMSQYVVFTLDEQRYALPLTSIERIVRAVEITPLPEGPKMLLGVINVEGRVLPTLNVRRRLGLPERQIQPSDQMVVAKAEAGSFVIVVDRALGIVECAQSQIVEAAAPNPELYCMPSLVKADEGLVVIQDAEAFFSLDESVVIDQLLQQETHQ